MKKTKKVGNTPLTHYIALRIQKHRLAVSLLLFLLLVLLYLNTANNHFYHRLHTAGLLWPQNQDSYTIGNTHSAKPLKYVALGDSLTTGVGADDFTTSYSYLVSKKLAGNHRSINLLPLATPGYKSIDLVTHYLDHTIQEQPDIVTVLIGVNDTHGLGPSSSQFRQNYATILERLRRETQATIYAVAIPYIGTDSLIWPPYKNYYSFRTYTFNTIIKELTGIYGVYYIDLYTPTIHYAATNSPYYSKDEFHPSSNGYSLWAEIIAHDINL